MTYSTIQWHKDLIELVNYKPTEQAVNAWDELENNDPQTALELYFSFDSTDINERY